MEIEEYRDKLTEILSEDPVDVKKFMDLSATVGVFLPSRKILLEMIICKLRCNMINIPEDIKDKSGKWLDEKGFSREIEFMTKLE